MLWMAVSGVLFAALNTLLRSMALDLNPFQVQALRYTAGFAVILPMIIRTGYGAWKPASGWWGQVRRGLVHTSSLVLWFTALPHITLAQNTAIGFTVPIFVMIGAVVFLGETMRWERWVAALIGVGGVLVVIGPDLSGSGNIYSLVMLGSSPLLAASFLISKALTRHDKPMVIVAWQSSTVALLSMPLALMNWTWPSPLQWGLFLLCGLIGSSGHYCLTRAFAAADISATQPARFLDLVWNVLAGMLVFGDIPTRDTLIGAAIIFTGTTWLARRERQKRAVPAT
jgi:drug/metabolite transporter (DMT)-like permease